ncbi:MAG TPA: hypothetical protein DCS15_00730 [Flavobacteriales bacterium]|nr:hypothetical protein [Flavobacteriales bacterium]
MKWTCLEINLHGDPALKLNSQPRADLAIDERSAKLFPEQISVDLSSFDLELTVYNLGRATAQSFEVRVHHTSENGWDTTYTRNMDGLSYKDTLLFQIALDPNSSYGENILSIDVDLPSNAVPELFDLSNNQLEYKFYITSDELVPVWP